MANEFEYDDDFFNDDKSFKPYNIATTAPVTQDPKSNGSVSNGHVQPDRRSIRSKPDSIKSSEKGRFRATESVKSSAKSKYHAPSPPPPKRQPKKEKTPESSAEEEEEEEEEEKPQPKSYATTNGATSLKREEKVPDKTVNNSHDNGREDTQLSYAPSHYEYEDTFVAESVNGKTQSEQEVRHGLASKNRLLIKKPKLRQKADQPSLAEPSTVQRLLSAKNTKMHEYVNRIHELENALQQVHNENKLLTRLQKIQEKEITHFQHDQEEVPRLIQHHQAEMKAVKLMLDKTKSKHQKTWKRLLDVENLLREEKQKSEQLQQIIDSRGLKERFELDRKLSQATETIEDKDRRILELESHLARLEKNFNRQLASEKSKTKELQLLVDDLQNRNTKLEFNLKEKDKELSIRDIYRQRAIQEPKTQLVPVGGGASTASSPGFTASMGNIAAAADTPRKPHPPAPPRRLPPAKAQKPPKPRPPPAVAPPPPNNNDTHRSDASNSRQPPPQPELGSKGFFITQLEMELAAKEQNRQSMDTAVTAYSPRDPAAAQKKQNNVDALRASDQRRREQEAEMDRQLATERALHQEMLRKQEQEKQEEERRKREEEIKRRQLLMAETDAARRRQQQQQKEEEERRRLDEQQRLKAEIERDEQIKAEQKRKEAEANDRALRTALEAQRQQRATLEQREKRDWQDAEEKRIKEQVLAKTNQRKLEWLSPSPDDSEEDNRNHGNDLLNFSGSKRTTNVVPARNTKRLDLLFSDDEDDGGFGLAKRGANTKNTDKLHNGLPAQNNNNSNGNGGGRPRAGAGSMAPFMLGDTSARDLGNDFLFGTSNTTTAKPGASQPGRGMANNNKPPAGRGSYQQNHLFGVDSPDPIVADFGAL